MGGVSIGGAVARNGKGSSHNLTNYEDDQPLFTQTDTCIYMSAFDEFDDFVKDFKEDKARPDKKPLPKVVGQNDKFS